MKRRRGISATHTKKEKLNHGRVRARRMPETIGRTKNLVVRGSFVSFII